METCSSFALVVGYTAIYAYRLPVEYHMGDTLFRYGRLFPACLIGTEEHFQD